jgi:hypothetical protein
MIWWSVSLGRHSPFCSISGMPFSDTSLRDLFRGYHTNFASCSKNVIIYSLNNQERFFARKIAPVTASTIRIPQRTIEEPFKPSSAGLARVHP